MISEACQITKDEHFEQLQFHSIINTVSKERCPDAFPLHWHKDVELLALPEDAAKDSFGHIRLNQDDYILHPGDILLIWPGELHEIIDNKQKALIALQFSLSVLTEIQDFVIYSNSFRKQHLLAYQLSPELNQMIFFSLNQIMHLAIDSKSQFRNVEMLIALYEVFITLGNDLHEKSAIAEAQQNGTDKMQLAREYIQEKCNTNITLETVAEYVGFSPCYFSRSFKNATTYSFVEYLMRQRVKRMQMLLTNSELSITEAANQAGFKSISTLNRIFKQYSGCSPSEYRKYYYANI